MKIYRVKCDVTNFQSFLPKDEAIWASGRLSLDGTSKLQSWEPPEIYVLQPKLRKGNFFNFGPGGFVADALATEHLRDLFEMSGELLPLECDGQEYFLVNVVGCFDLLDQELTEGEVNKKGIRFRITKYVFNQNRLVENPLFKIPDTARAEILTSKSGDAETDFKRRLEEAGLTGLILQELWES